MSWRERGRQRAHVSERAGWESCCAPARGGQHRAQQKIVHQDGGGDGQQGAAERVRKRGAVSRRRGSHQRARGHHERRVVARPLTGRLRTQRAKLFGSARLSSLLLAPGSSSACGTPLDDTPAPARCTAAASSSPSAVRGVSEQEEAGHSRPNAPPSRTATAATVGAATGCSSCSRMKRDRTRTRGTLVKWSSGQWRGATREPTLPQPQPTAPCSAVPAPPLSTCSASLSEPI